MLMSIFILTLMILSLIYKRKYIPLIFILLGVVASLLNGVELREIALNFSNALSSVFLSIGLNIVVIIAFSEYVNKNGATKDLVLLVYKPISKIKDRYLILAMFYLIGLALSTVITSASALSMIYMSTVFPILISKGISKEGAAGMIASVGVIEFGHLKSSTIFMAEEQNRLINDYVINGQLFLFIGIAIVGAISHYFWQRYLDNRLTNDNDEKSLTDNQDYQHKISIFTALLPLLPLFLILPEHLFTKLNLPLWTIGMICISISFILDLKSNKFNVKEQLSFFLTSISNSFFFIVSVIVGGKFLVNSLPIESIINIYSHMSLGSINPIILSSVLLLAIVLFCTLLGSGTVSFITITSIMSKFKIVSMNQFSSTFTSMQMISGIGRTISPVSPTTLLCSQISGVTLSSIILRNIVPTILIVILSIIYSNI
ncbi:C4-dicarboxylate ABC transporter [Aliivibrio fischeri]|nr:C4-dicarboxylate ABC transporter [Aliivibrio fischeri]MUL20488.1 C4-dicarboxylate ABC transporter [Aliivibrio fischeri]MUL24263.1 C4-dicarboxylate ABC transporter [Aliivibrio fischeri]